MSAAGKPEDIEALVKIDHFLKFPFRCRGSAGEKVARTEEWFRQVTEERVARRIDGLATALDARSNISFEEMNRRHT
jgi:hypothetical protein